MSKFKKAAKRRSAWLAAIAAAFILTFGLSASSATAAPASTPASVSTAAQAASGSVGAVSTRIDDDTQLKVNGTTSACRGEGMEPPSAKLYLPLNRWGSVSYIHTRTQDGISVIPSLGAVQRTIFVTGSLSIGNGLWRMTSSMVSTANDFCIGENIGRTVDKTVATIFSSLVASGVIALLLVINLVMALFKSRNGGGNFFSTIFKHAAIIGIMAGMAFGAAGTTTAKYGQFSPGWWMKTTNDTVSSIAAAPAWGLSKAARAVAFDDASSGRCGRYVDALMNEYESGYTSIYKPMSAVPTAVNSLWLTSGYPAYVNAQFGAENVYGKDNACILLDAVGGYSATNATVNGVAYKGRQALTEAATGVRIPTDSLALGFRGTEATDRAMIGWAACNPSGATAKSEWTSVANIANPECKEFFKEGSAEELGGSSLVGDAVASTAKGLLTGGLIGGAIGGASSVANADEKVENQFDFPSGSDRQDAVAMQNQSMGNYIKNLQGTDAADALAVAEVYAFSALISAIVFGLLSLAVVAAKIAMLVLMLMAIFVLLAGLLPGSDPVDRAVSLAKSFVGAAVITACASAVISVIAVLSALIAQAGSAAVAAGSFTSILWAGLAPVAALLVLRYLFKNVFKAPSPFSLKGALAYGAAGAGGAVAGSGMAGFAGRRGGRLGHALQREALSRVGLGRLGGRRAGGMIGAMTAAAGGAAAGAAAGNAGTEALLERSRRSLERPEGIPEGDGIDDGSFLDPSRLDQEGRIGLDGGDGEYDPLLDVDRVATGATSHVAPEDIKKVKRTEADALRGARQDWVDQQTDLKPLSMAEIGKQRVKSWGENVAKNPVKWGLKTTAKTAALGAAVLAAPVALPALVAGGAAVAGLKAARSAERLRQARSNEFSTRARSQYAQAVEDQQRRASAAAHREWQRQGNVISDRAEQSRAGAAEKAQHPDIDADNVPQPPPGFNEIPVADDPWVPPSGGRPSPAAGGRPAPIPGTQPIPTGGLPSPAAPDIGRIIPDNPFGASGRRGPGPSPAPETEMEW